MKEKKYFCPVCKTRLEEQKNNSMMKCSKCGLVLSKSNLESVVYCHLCNKLYSDTISYNDHLLVCEKEHKKVMVIK